MLPGVLVMLFVFFGGMVAKCYFGLTSRGLMVHRKEGDCIKLRVILLEIPSSLPEKTVYEKCATVCYKLLSNLLPILPFEALLVLSHQHSSLTESGDHVGSQFYCLSLCV
uniref:Putative secreted protein n=1 Tax=Amblyomma cajennense TaxID=34607 RepID=A0A023FDW3_AMBCJ